MIYCISTAIIDEEEHGKAGRTARRVAQRDFEGHPM